MKLYYCIELYCTTLHYIDFIINGNTVIYKNKSFIAILLYLISKETITYAVENKFDYISCKIDLWSKK